MRALPLLVVLVLAVAGIAGFAPSPQPGHTALLEPPDFCVFVWVHAPAVFEDDPRVSVCTPHWPDAG